MPVDAHYHSIVRVELTLCGERRPPTTTPPPRSPCICAPIFNLKQSGGLEDNGTQGLSSEGLERTPLLVSSNTGSMGRFTNGPIPVNLKHSLDFRVSEVRHLFWHKSQS